VVKDDWRPRPSPFCMTCSFQTMCPAWAARESPVSDESPPG
jgi:hypothetical protein